VEGSSFECDEGAGFSACTSPRTTGALADGPHDFLVRATDPVGNVDPTPASRSFTVDTTPPALTPPVIPVTPVTPSKKQKPKCKKGFKLEKIKKKGKKPKKKCVKAKKKKKK
jgi:hypothetical protein